MCWSWGGVVVGAWRGIFGVGGERKWCCDVRRFVGPLRLRFFRCVVFSNRLCNVRTVCFFCMVFLYTAVDSSWCLEGNIDEQRKASKLLNYSAVAPEKHRVGLLSKPHRNIRMHTYTPFDRLFFSSSSCPDMLLLSCSFAHPDPFQLLTFELNALTDQRNPN